MRLFLTALLLLIYSAASAHETSPSIATLKLAQDGNFELGIQTNVEALLAKIGPEHDDTDDAPTAELYNQLRNVPPNDLRVEFEKFAPEFLADLGLTFDKGPAELTLKNVEVPPVGDTNLARESTVTLQGKVPSGTNAIGWAFPERYGASVLRIQQPGQEIQAQFFNAGASNPSILDLRSSFQKFYDYAEIGFTHILPKGLDHILFVLGLFFLSISWRPLIAQVTAFTIAHSITLAMGLYGVVIISPAIVEPLIALSIVYVAVENILTKKLHVWRPVIVFLFGLLHGLGFAGILTEVGLASSDFVLGLVAFNIGVELGQLAVILLAFIAVGWFAKKAWYRTRVAIPASVLIGLVGAYWFVERTLL